MNFIKKIEFENFDQLKDAVLNNVVVHAIPKNIKIEIQSFYLDFINYIGVPFSADEDFSTKNKTGHLWSHIKYDSEKNTSFSHSNTRQPFHTDGAYEKKPPNISFFYCVEQALFGGATTFVKLETLIDCISFYDKSLLSEIRSVEMKFFKGDDGKKSVILDEKNNIVWNYFRVEKNKTAEYFHSFLEEKIYQGGIYDSVRLNKNESLFFWDEKVLHGRNSFIGNRHLIKAGINVF